MTRTEDDLREFFADQPADPAAEQRLAERFTGVRPGPGRAVAQRWVVAAAAVGAVLVAASLSMAGAWARQHAGESASAAAGPSPSSRPPAGSGTVATTPQVAVHTLIGLLPTLPPGGRISGLDGGTRPGRILGGLEYHSPRGSAFLRVEICLSADVAPPPCPPGHDLPTVTTLADGYQVEVGEVPSEAPFAPTTGSMPPSPGTSGSVAVVGRPERLASAQRPDGLRVTVSEQGPGGARIADLPLTSQQLVSIVTSSRWRARVPAALATAVASLFPPGTPTPGPGLAIPSSPRPGMTH